MKYLFPLKERLDIAEGTMAFRFDTTGAEFTFKPGQNCDFTLINPPHIDEEGSVRTFSIVNPPSEANILMIATRMRDTAFKNSLKEIPLGTKVKVDGPRGSFTLHEDTSKAAVFLGGGIGITPMHSIIADAADRHLPHKIFLFYSNRTVVSTAFFADLERYKQANPNFTFVPTLTDETPADWHYEHGPITQAMIQKYLPDLGSAIYYLSGPEGMVKAMRDILINTKISGDAIKTEEFSGY